ncbi:PH domain-containing protein [Halosegnis longus]|uniref:PH domain-containing protein n=1 Tax=Halosegnis longus TaxID=2216012 RepID=UPI000AC7861A|nr:PH domain-containing protein [Salella cibi]
MATEMADRQTLDSGVRIVWGVWALVGALMLAGIAGAAGFATVAQILLPAGVTFLVVAGLGVVYTLARYRAWWYAVRADSLHLSRGVLTHVHTVVPFVRVQHVDVSRGPLERALGLSSVVVYTAGSRGADVTIPGLTPDRADRLQQRLKRLAIDAEGEDAV